MADSFNFVSDFANNIAYNIARPSGPSGQRVFRSRWDTTKPGPSANNQIKLPVRFDGSYTFLVKWGDGNEDTITAFNDPAVTHTYAVPGIYDVEITGLIKGFAFLGIGDQEKLLNISEWGVLNIGGPGVYFLGASNLTVTAIDVPDLAGVLSFISMFQSCLLFNGFVNNWDVSQIINFTTWFFNCPLFNQPMDNLDVGNGTAMTRTLEGALLFDQSLGSWNVRNVQDMSNMLLGSGFSTISYDPTLIGWNGLPFLQNAVQFHAGNAKFSAGAAAAARASIILNWSWTITDGGPV